MQSRGSPAGRSPILNSLILAVALGLAPASAGAATITFGYAGTITSASGSIEGFAELPFSVGDPIIGSFTFDPYAAPSSATLSSATYYSALESSTADVGPITFTQDITQTSASCSPAPDCSVPPGGWYEAWMRVGASTVDYGGQEFLVDALAFDPNFDLVVEFALYLEGIPGLPELDPPVITSTDLPLTPYDPDLFLSTWGRVERAFTTADSSGWFRADFTVDDLYVVSLPEPSLILLGGAGLVAITLGRKARSKR